MPRSAKPLFRARMATSKASLPIDLPEARAPHEPRRALDFYPTKDLRPIRALLSYDGERIRESGTVWEPCCGDGAMVMQIREGWHSMLRVRHC